MFQIYQHISVSFFFCFQFLLMLRSSTLLHHPHAYKLEKSGTSNVHSHFWIRLTMLIVLNHSTAPTQTQEITLKNIDFEEKMLYQMNFILTEIFSYCFLFVNLTEQFEMKGLEICPFMRKITNHFEKMLSILNLLSEFSYFLPYFCAI